MGKPVKHRDKWRIRWFDENGKRRSEDYDEYKNAQYKLSQPQAAVEEIRRGLRSPDPVLSRKLSPRFSNEFEKTNGLDHGSSGPPRRG